MTAIVLTIGYLIFLVNVSVYSVKIENERKEPLKTVKLTEITKDME